MPNYLFLVHINTIYFALLTLHPVTLLKLLLVVVVFVVDSIMFSTYIILPSAINDSFTSSFPM
jgi:hypothetical protein